MSTADDVDYVLEKTSRKLLLVEPAFLPKVTRGLVMDDAFHEKLLGYDGGPVEAFVANEDPTVIIFTSGTTARPKGVVLTHLNWYAYLIASYSDLGLDRSLRYLLALPMFHVAGLMLTFSCIASGCDSVIIPLAKPEPIFRAIVDHKVNTMALPATVWVGLLQIPGIESADLSSLKRPIVFQYLPTPVFERWRRMVPHAESINGCGQTATTGLASFTRPSA